MEADWEFEIAPDAPVIDAAWSGFVDLRLDPRRAFELPETVEVPGLAETLGRLNGPAAPVWTAKCDVWAPTEFDPDELDAPLEAGREVLACYIDLLPGDEQMWPTLDAVADWCRSSCAALRGQVLRQCRVDLVVRRALLTPDRTGLGVTAYLVGCGTNGSAAAGALTTALRAFADAVCSLRLSAAPGQKLQ